MQPVLEPQGPANDPPAPVDPVRVAVVGAGYVGAVTGACLAAMGHAVTLVDLDAAVVDRLNAGVAGFAEPGLDPLLARARAAGTISATVDLRAALRDADLSFICVGTPSTSDGSCSLGAVRAAARSIGEALAGRTRPHTVAVKSTVPPFTTDEVVRPTLLKYAGEDAPVAVVTNPEFLREGSAVADFYAPDRIVIGASGGEDAQLERLYAPWACPVVRTTCATAEMVKYASNAMLAARLSTANEIGRVCAAVDIDAREVMRAVGLDRRIGPQFLKVGLGFGGSCLPKDVRALIAFAWQHAVEPRLLAEVLAVNDQMADDMLDLTEVMAAPVCGARIGVLGLAFKPGTDDVRESRAVAVIHWLFRYGASVVAYDPMAMDRCRDVLPQIDYAASAEEVLDQADVIVIATEWPAFEELDYAGHLVVDGRGCDAAKRTAAEYLGLMW